MKKDFIYYTAYPFVLALFLIKKIPIRIYYTIFILIGSIIWLHQSGYVINNEEATLLFVTNMSWIGWLLFSFFDNRTLEAMAENDKKHH
jgi:hypothetical protein